MSNFAYKKYFNLALNKLRTVREPHPESINDKRLGWNEVLDSRIFDIGGKEYYLYNKSMRFAIDISVECIWQIIMSLSELKNIKIEPIEFSDETKRDFSVFNGLLYSFKCGSTLYLFKHCENSQVYLRDKITDEIVNNSEYEHCMIVYFLNNNVDLIVMGNKKQDDMMTIFEFWESVFGKEERLLFEEELNNYLENVNRCLGYTIVKSLTPYSLINFKKVVENTVKKYSFRDIINKKVLNKKVNKKFELLEVDFDKINNSFFEKKNYLSLFSNEEFADSFISSEWIYFSMHKAQAVDLTSIVIGYFKAMEQLLYSIVLLHLNEKRMMKKAKTKDEKIELCQENINAINFAIGSMAEFYRDNKDVFLNELSYRGKTYIVESIFSFAELRNGFTHKHNIYKWEKVDEIRLASYDLLFLLLGGYRYDNVKKLKIPDLQFYDDFTQLCEYVNFHSGDLFYLEKEGLSGIFFACPDEYSEVCENGYVKYSGAYFRNLDNSKKFRIDTSNLPKTIWLGNLGIENVEKVKFNPKKIQKVFENGKFIGNSITEEYERNYY